MKNARQFVFILFVTILFVSFGTKANACDLSAIRSEYSARGLSGSGIEQEAIDSCLNEQRAQGQAAGEQATADSEYALTMYKIKLDYFYKLDEIEYNFVQLDTSGYCFLSSMNCLESKKIPSNPTTLSADLFLRYMPYKEACSKDLSECIGKKINNIQTKPPTKTDDQICSDKFGQNWVWSSGTSCVCKDGYIQKEGKCITYDQSCNTSFPNAIFIRLNDTKNGLICDCKTGYQWNNAGTACEKAAVSSSSSSSDGVGLFPTIGIPEGSIIKTADNPDVYIVKYKNGKQFKRLILSPSVFKSYAHLKWENIKTVSQATMNYFVTSDLVQVAGDSDTYKLYPQGDVGEKRSLINVASYWTGTITSYPDYDSIYEINAVDRDSYTTLVGIFWG